jgi:hypothetical protein
VLIGGGGLGDRARRRRAGGDRGRGELSAEWRGAIYRLLPAEEAEEDSEEVETGLCGTRMSVNAREDCPLGEEASGTDTGYCGKGNADT